MNKKPNETIEEYKIRLCENKDICDFNWKQICDLIESEFGEIIAPKTLQQWWSIFKSGLEYATKQNLSDDKIIAEYELKRIQFEKEKQKFFDQRTSYSKLVREDSRKDEIKELISDSIKQSELVEFNYANEVKFNSDNDLLISLNDLHYGIDFSNYWNTYNPEICKEYLEKYLQNIVKIKETHESENCFVFSNGDLISGSTHLSIRVENRENIIRQIMGVSELIANFLYELSKMFNNVTFATVAGNHSRIEAKNDAHKDERLDDLIPWYVESRLQNVHNVQYVKNIDTTMYMVNIRGKKYLGVHGDFESGKAAYSSLNLMAGENTYCIVTGHLHHNMTQYVNGIKVIMAGSFLGTDSYCITKRIVGIPQQMVCVCSEDGIIASYDINF